MSFTGKRLLQAAPSGGLIGEVTLASPEVPNTGTWTVPDGVYSISVLTIGAGQNGAQGSPGTASTPGQGGRGGDIGTVHYKNNIPVIPGQEIPYRVGIVSATAGNRNSIFEATDTPRPAGYTAIVVPGVTKAEDGGAGSTTTYESGYGGRGTTRILQTAPSTTPVTLTGSRNPGTTTPQGTGASGRPAELLDFGGGGGGGGGGARQDGAQGGAGGNGRRGGIRIVWPGDTRQFPDDV